MCFCWKFLSGCKAAKYAQIPAPTGTRVSKRLGAAYKIAEITSCINPWLVMRLLPMKEPDKAWRSIKSQWKKDSEAVGEDYSTLAMGSYAVIDGLTKDDKNPSLFCLSEGDRSHAVCQVSRIMMSKYPTPTLRARFTTLSPVYELGIADVPQYAPMIVALLSRIAFPPRT